MGELWIAVRLRYAADPAREPRGFRLSLSWEMGQKRGKQAESFVAESRRQSLEFYRVIVQGFEAMECTARRLTGEEPEASPVATSEPPTFGDEGREFGQASLPEG